MRLCATTQLPQANLLAFIDRNPQLNGKKILGVPVLKPSCLPSVPANTVLIASTTYAEEIKQILQNELRWTGRIKKIFP